MKIWSKSVLVLAAGTLMFSSCLKNIEPEGLADLRGAKAELLRAQTAVEAANAAKVNADAALVLAQAKVQEALAKQAEAKAAYDAALARLQELEVEKQTALNQIEIEQAMAEAQAAIAEAEANAAKIAAEAEQHLLGVLTNVAEAQVKYEEALKNLALAAATLEAYQVDKLEAMQQAVQDAREDVAELTVEFEHAAIELAYALALVDDEAAAKTVVRYAEIELLKAQATLEGAVEAEAIAKAAVELDLPTIADWKTKGNEYWAEAEKLESEYWKRYGEIEDAMSAMKDSIAVDENDKPVGAIAVKKANYTAYTGYAFHEDAGVFAQTRVEYTAADTRTAFKIPYFDIKAPVDAEGKPIEGLNDFSLSKYEYYFEGEDAVIKEFENYLKGLATINAESIQEKIANEKARLSAAQSDPLYKFFVKTYNDAVAAYKADDVLPFYTKYVFDEGFDLNAAVKEYNDALAVLKAAVKNYEDNYEKYTPDFSAELKAANDVRDKAYAVAVNAQYAAYQKAYDDNKIAYLTHMAKKAEAIRKAAEDEGADDAVIKSLTEAETKAKADLTKATEAYTKAKTAADEACKKAKTAADEAYAKAIAAVDAKVVGFDEDFKNNLIEQVKNAVAVLNEKVDAINGEADPLIPYTISLTGVVVPDDDTSFEIKVLEFMFEITDDLSFRMKSIEVADVVDKEDLKDGIKVLVALLTTVGDNDNTEYAGYPFELPTAEQSKDFYEDKESYLDDDDLVSPLYAEVIAQAEIAKLEAQIAALDQLPDYIKAIEAAKAEFETLVKENADKLAADKAEVEAFYARYIPLKEKNDKELAAMKAKTDVMVARFNAIGDIIADYCDDADEDYLTDALYAQYEAAAMMLTFAETSVYEAEVNLEKAKNGLVTLAEFAQMNYDAVATDLAIAMAKLEGATAALENAIAVIYGVEPVAPQAPVTPPAGDDTTDEGGEAEGGEGEGGEETPAE